MQAQPGRVDPSFSVPRLRFATALGLTPDGRVLIAGTFTNAPTGAGVVLLTPEGSVAWRSDPLVSGAQLIAASDVGDIFVGGNNRVARFRPPATAEDPSFASGVGWRSPGPMVDGSAARGNASDLGRRSDREPDGLAGGTRASESAAPDRSGWRPGRRVRHPCRRRAKPGCRGESEDGSFLAVRTSIQRLLADGTIDASFTPWTAANVEILRRLPSGDYLMGGGAFRTYGGAAVKSLIRVDANGVRDVSFDYVGTFDVQYDAAGAHRPVGICPDGRLVVGQQAGEGFDGS